MTYVGTQLGRVGELEIAAAALVAQAEHTRHLIRSAYDAFVSINRSGKIIDWNTAAESMFGWSRDEALGLQLAEVIVPERYRQAHLDGIERYLATGEGPVLNKRLELSALHRTGREFPIELAIWPVGHGEGQAFCAFVRDITERKRAEDAPARASSRRAERRPPSRIRLRQPRRARSRGPSWRRCARRTRPPPGRVATSRGGQP